VTDFTGLFRQPEREDPVKEGAFRISWAKRMVNIRNIRIGQRLTIGFGLVIALMILLAGLALTRIRDLSHETTGIVATTYPQTVTANRMKAHLNEISRSMLSVLVMSDEDQIKGELANIAKFENLNVTLAAEVEKGLTDEADKELLANLTKYRERSNKAQKAFVELVQAGQKEEALTKFLFSVRSMHTKYFEALEQLNARQNGLMEAAGARSVETARNTTVFILGLAGAILAVSVVVAILATRSITRPLTRAVRVAKQVAAGDLSASIQSDSQDETGELMRALEEMNRSLQRIVGDVRLGTVAIASASSEIASGNSDLSVRTEEQASSLAQTSSAMGELTRIVRQNAENASQANQLASAASQVAAQGGGARWSGGGPGGRHDGGDQRLVAQDRRHHQRDRWHRLPDQHPGPQRRRGSRPRG
jgi:methyl-accepting chemotaxis protein